MTRLLAVALAVLVAVGGCVLTEESLAIRKIAREVNERVYGLNRFVDVGVELDVIRLDRNGPIALESGRRVSVVRTHRWGGILDTKDSTPHLVGPSKSPRRWMCSSSCWRRPQRRAQRLCFALPRRYLCSLRRGCL